jgi:hypothetical protein
VPDWLEWLVWIAAGVGATGVLWRQVVRPMARAITNTEKMVPVLFDIAQEFQPNDGRTLHDRIVKIEREVTEACALIAKHMETPHG